MKRFKIRQMAGCLALAAAGAGCTQDGAVPAAKDRQSQPVPVRIVSVAKESVRRTSVQPATVHPLFEAAIRPKVDGYVESLKVDIGDFVSAGTVLAEVDLPEWRKQREILEARLARLQAEERRAQAGIVLAEANVASAEALLAQAKAQMARAEAMLTASEAEFSRVSDLVSRQSIESRVLDEVRKRRDADLASREAVRSAIASAEADVVVSEARLTSAQADLTAAQADTRVAQKQLEEVDVTLDYGVLKAPFDGVVTFRSVNPGDLVTKGDKDAAPLFRISRLDQVRVHVQVPERDAAFVNVGDTMTLTFPSFPGEELTATVTRLAQSLDHNTRTMLVEAVLENADRKLLPGMFGQATITLSTRLQASVLPARAVRFDETGKAFVYAVGDDNVVAVVPVEIGGDDGHTIEILSGLSSPQRVIDSHLQRFTDGQVVSVLPPRP